MKRNTNEMMNSTIFSNNNSLTLDTCKSGLNNNVIVVGSSGSGKTRKFIKPNIFQKNTSYIITDVKGNLVNECGEILSNKQDENDREYAIKVLNLIDLTKSMHYNPFVYIDNEEDIFSIVEFVVANNNNGYRVTNDSFWQEASTMLLTALIGFVYYNLSDDERNFNSVMKLLDNASVERRIATCLNDKLKCYIFQDITTGLFPNDRNEAEIRQTVVSLSNLWIIQRLDKAMTEIMTFEN